MAQYTFTIPELANAELKVSVDVERIPSTPTEGPFDVPAELPAFAQLRPMRVVISLGGETVYTWARERVPAPGAAPARPR